MSDLPIIIGEAGAQPTDPAVLFDTFTQKVANRVPGYTVTLPAALITDLASTATGALAAIDQARVDVINSVSPYGVNEPLLEELSYIYGTVRGTENNVSVLVVFTGTPGLPVSKGFLVGDGNRSYSVQSSFIIPSSGQSSPVLCVAVESGTWAVPAGSVTQLVSSVPAQYDLSCNNQTAGNPPSEPESLGAFRYRMMREGMFAVQGTPPALKASVRRVPGVRENLVAFRQPSAGKWVVVVGADASDRNEIAYAIFQAIPDISTLTNDVKNGDGTVPEKVSVTIYDHPDEYTVPYVVPVSQRVNLLIQWNSRETSFIDQDAVQATARENIADYINNITTGDPISLFQIQEIFLNSIQKLAQRQYISKISITVDINGKRVEPDNDTQLVYGQTYAYFLITERGITIQRVQSK